ncbi:MAG: YtxH domain-containing protein [Elusimicrobia bacterium]|nr:YtxH domain-containing protein [Elusimicrobiota bacterium]
MTEERSGGNTLAVLLIGAAVGAVAGLFLAPRSGRDTRRRLSHFLDRLEDGGKDLLDGGREVLARGKDTARKLRRTVETAARDLEDKIS